MLDAIEEIHGDNVSEFYYIGDMPDDMVAASKSKAGYVAIGILVSSSEKESLKEDLLRAGADYIVEDFEQLMRIVEFKER